MSMKYIYYFHLPEINITHLFIYFGCMCVCVWWGWGGGRWEGGGWAVRGCWGCAAATSTYSSIYISLERLGCSKLRYESRIFSENLQA